MIIQLLVFVIMFRNILGCTEELDKEEFATPYQEYSDEYDEYQSEPIVHSGTITCTNLTSSTQISSSYSYMEQNYEQYLKVSKSSIATWEPSALSTFSTITKLYLPANHIKTILPGAFNGLTRLRELYLNNNNLREIFNGVFNSLHRLEILDLSHNLISQIHNHAFMGLSSLQALYLEKNNITEIEESTLDSIKHLNFLNVSENPLEAISLDCLSSIDNLIITNTALSDFCEDLTNLTVKMMNLSSNQISVIDFSLFPKAETIDLSNNLIEDLDNCEYLDTIHIYLSYNNIPNINCTIIDASTIDVQHNKIKYLQRNIFQNCSKSLIVLNLSFNSISELENDIFQNLKFLLVLHLQNNKIGELKIGLFRDLSELKFLNLSHNKIEQFQYGTFDSLKQLANLDISHNQLLDLQQYSFSSLSKLQALHFDNNEISSFDATDLSKHLPNLDSVYLNYNPWTCKYLVQIFKLLNSEKVITVDGNNFENQNFHGIRCSNEKQVVQPTNTNASHIKKFIRDFKSALNERLKAHFFKPLNLTTSTNFVKGFQQSLNETLNNSKIEQFFNTDFLNSKFFQYFNKEYSNTSFFKFFKNYQFGISKDNLNGNTAAKLTSAEINSNESGNPVRVFSAIMLVVMLCLMAVILCLLLKLVKNETNRIQSESAMELS